MRAGALVGPNSSASVVLVWRFNPAKLCSSYKAAELEARRRIESYFVCQTSVTPFTALLHRSSAFTPTTRRSPAADLLGSILRLVWPGHRLAFQGGSYALTCRHMMHRLNWLFGLLHGWLSCSF